MVREPPQPDLADQTPVLLARTTNQRIIAQENPTGSPAPVSSSITAVANKPQEIRTIHIANNTASAAKYSIYHDDSGTTADDTTRILRGSVSGDADVILDVSIPFKDIGSPLGTITMESDTSAALTFTLYGI